MLALVCNQTPELCILAVKCCYYALGYVREQTYEIVQAAFEVNKDALYYMDEKYK